MDHLARTIEWRRADATVFVHAARVDGAWWVLRRNGFPDHPLCTLFVDGVVVGDVEDLSARAPGWDLTDTSLTGAERDAALTPLRGLARYGSEVGRPCDGDWCCAGK